MLMPFIIFFLLLYANKRVHFRSLEVAKWLKVTSIVSRWRIAVILNIVKLQLLGCESCDFAEIRCAGALWVSGDGLIRTAIRSRNRESLARRRQQEPRVLFGQRVVPYFRSHYSLIQRAKQCLQWIV